MPCKGDEPHLAESIEAILNQSYPKFHTIIITDTKDDPAYSVAADVLSRHSTGITRICTAEAHPRASGKVAALLTGLELDDWASEVYVFVDSDALTPKSWLTNLVDPLRDPSVGATTGFRWYFPEGGLWSQVESAWNASGMGVMFSKKYNFPWGGSMALLRETINNIHLRAQWETAISDDLTLNKALRSRQYRIEFLPQCTVVTYTQATARTFLTWAVRQVSLTRVFNTRLWNFGLAAYGLLTLFSVLGIATLILAAIASPTWLLPAVLLLTPSIVGVIGSSGRISAFKRALPDFGLAFERSRWAHSITSLIVPWVMMFCILKSAQTDEIEWRGRKYKLTGQT